MGFKVSLVYPPKKLVCQTLGLPYIAAALEREGYDVDLIDSTALGWGFEELRDYFKRKKPDAVGVGNVFTPEYANCIKTCEIAKEESPECFTVIGGLHAFLQPQDFFTPAVDAVAACEGEY
ncbi:cobalamin B12-binding domain-containing protein, partial [Candidatus Micrarchaeota archaeon]|nr:cobalamin B12-binding domain-containing protein [Candidatus Micrarchaeota archaeon]